MPNIIISNTPQAVLADLNKTFPNTRRIDYDERVFKEIEEPSLRGPDSLRRLSFGSFALGADGFRPRKITIGPDGNVQGYPELIYQEPRFSYQPTETEIIAVKEAISASFQAAIPSLRELLDNDFENATHQIAATPLLYFLKPGTSWTGPWHSDTYTQYGPNRQADDLSYTSYVTTIIYFRQDPSLESSLSFKERGDNSTSAKTTELPTKPGMMVSFNDAALQHRVTIKAKPGADDTDLGDRWKWPERGIFTFLTCRGKNKTVSPSEPSIKTLSTITPTPH